MKETITIEPDGGLVITWEAETPEEEAELKEQALAIVRGEELPLDALPDPYPCPQRCGGFTEDPYGGPCKACWDAIP